MDFQSHESKECGQRWMGDPNLGKERTRGTHKEDMTIKKKKNSNHSLDHLHFYINQRRTFKKLPTSFYLLTCYLASFFLLTDESNISQSES